MNEVSSKHSSEVSEDIPLEAGEDSQADNNRDPNLVEENACLKIPTCLFHGNEEALAWAIDNCITITAFIGVGAFLGTALLKLAANEAGCQTDPNEGEIDIPKCDRRVYGIKPSSLLSTMKTIVDLVSACMMPLFGAIVDTTPHRRALGRCCVIFFALFLFLGIFVAETTWFAIAIMQIIWGFTVWFQNMITYSYLPDLTTNETIMNEYTRAFAALSYLSMVLYMGAVIGSKAAMGYLDKGANEGTLEDEKATARLAQSISFTLCTVGFSIAWGILFKKREPLRQLPEGESILKSGFQQLRRTIREIHQRHLRLKWFYISVMFCDPAIMALTVLSITFLTDQLHFTAQENGTAMLVMMLCAIPGSFIGSWVTKKINAVISSMMAIVILIVTTVAVAIMLKGSGQQTETYILAGGWGLGTGWKWAQDRMVLLLVLPPGQNAELMGVYVFFRQILSWLPPLVFTILNERDVEQRFGMATLIIYFALSFLACIAILLSSNQSAPVGEADVVALKSSVHNDEESPEIATPSE